MKLTESKENITKVNDTLTVSQKLAINADNSNVLVSASAGSGKTFVMIERVKRLILQKEVDVNRILCVTFTVLAAKEMKQKLLDAITKELKVSDGEKKKRLIYQLDLLPTASISTVHAFCKSLLSEFFYEVGLDPSFVILDDKNTKMLVNRAIDRLFEDLYEQNDSDLLTVLPYCFSNRSDYNLKQNVLRAYYAVISEANPKQILLNGEYYYTPEGTAYISEFFANEYKKKAIAIAKQLEEFKDDIVGFEKLENYVHELYRIFLGIGFCDGLDSVVEYAKQILPKKPSVRANTPEDEAFLIAQAEQIVLQGKELFKSIKSHNLVADELQMALKNRTIYNSFINIVIKFFDYYEKEKREENGVDYSDLEHLTLKLLKNEAIKNEIASRFDYIFTDEYQDTSGVQEAILTAISTNNLFMVGDLKQSIYDFRGCNPEIFANKFQKYQKSDGGIAINLDNNFRSSYPVIGAVNRVFGSIMTKECGSVDYAKSPMVVGAKYPENEGEVKFISVPKNKREKIIPEGIYSVVNHLKSIKSERVFNEGKLIAELVENIVGKRYFDIKSKGYKTIDYSDIAILLRDANKDADAYTSELVRAGIPVSAPSKDSIANYAEIAMMVDLLKLIDCYNQDIPLASVLKSEIAKLTDAELLKIRKLTPSGNFVDAVYNYRISQTDETALKLQRFEEYFNRLRLLSEFMTCGELLDQIVRENAIDINLLSSRLGEIKLARLNKFIEVASSSKQTVNEFLKGLDGLLEKLTMKFSSSSSVQIMSIHASKGLEFPIVILAKTTKPFNMKGIEGDFICDRNFGVSINYRDRTKMTKKETIFNRFVKYNCLKRMCEEEMRLLYVAMTRAKNSLYITGEFTNIDNALPKEHHFANEVFNSKKYFDMFASSDFVCEIQSELNATFTEREVRQVLVSEADEYMKNKIASNLSFKYAYKNNSSLSVKRSVTSASHYEEKDSTCFERSPIFGESDTETGNAYHRFLELCNFSNEPENEFNRLIDGDLFENEYKKLIDKSKISKVLQMPIFNSLNGYSLYKEQPFTAFVPANMVESDYTGESEILLQGIIDLLAVKDEEAIIIDYKYSTVINQEKLVERYKKQLELYSFAVEKVLKKKVKATYLLNLNTCKLIEVKI